MAQIQGSGTGNFTNTAMVDSTIGSQVGRVWTSPSSFNLEIAKGNIDGLSTIHKFGNSPDFDTTDGVITIWDGANDAGLNEMTYNYSSSADIDSLISTNSTDTQLIEVQGLDSDGLLKVQQINLAGSARSNIGSPLIRVFRMINCGSTDLDGTVSAYVSGPTTAGTPDTTADVRSQIIGSNNQTLMAVFTIPSNQEGYLGEWFASTAGASKTTGYIIDLVARPSGGVFQLKNRASLIEDGSSHIIQRRESLLKLDPFTDVEMRVRSTAGGVSEATISAGFDILLLSGA